MIKFHIWLFCLHWHFYWPEKCPEPGEMVTVGVSYSLNCDHCLCEGNWAGLHAHKAAIQKFCLKLVHTYWLVSNLDFWSSNLCDQFSFILSRFRELIGFSKVDSWKVLTIDRLIAEPVRLPLNRNPLRIALCKFRRIFAIILLGLFSYSETL